MEQRRCQVIREAEENKRGRENKSGERGGEEGGEENNYNTSTTTTTTVANDTRAPGSNCASAGDLLCDTPADPGLSETTVDTSCQYTGTAVDAEVCGIVVVVVVVIVAVGVVLLKYGVRQRGDEKEGEIACV